MTSHHLPSLLDVTEGIRSEAVGKKLVESGDDASTVSHNRRDKSLGAKLDKHLPAGTTWHGRLVSLGGYNYMLELHVRAFFGNGLDEGTSLSTDAGRIGGVFDVCAGVDVT